MNIYDFTVKDATGSERRLEEFRDQVILVVNVASKCGFTPQYDGLEKLYREFRDKGFTVLGFPSNQFGEQEPGTDEDIQDFCRLNYGVSFPVLSKIEVNGENAHPLYKYLKEQDYDEFINVPEDYRSYERHMENAGGPEGREISWNFNKFLISRQGRVVGRYASTTTPEELEGRIKKLLAERPPISRLRLPLPRRV